MNVKKLRLLVLQLPVVQGLVYMVLLVMWAEEEVEKIWPRSYRIPRDECHPFLTL